MPSELTLEELELETAEYLPPRLVMSSCCRPCCEPCCEPKCEIVIKAQLCFTV
jgi:hypothetical protein